MVRRNVWPRELHSQPRWLAQLAIRPGQPAELFGGDERIVEEHLEEPDPAR
jgi:hypothetical protein